MFNTIYVKKAEQSAFSLCALTVIDKVIERRGDKKWILKIYLTSKIE